ncbi:hypothetical protein CA207_11610 [Macrococcoides caseolyticum]|uniref:hypothetical protein n=1 Tax=Macrococcoides caseolyticum TaxID=69966 RepID=UPI000A295348|nr:hypothetical protein [Macrococcus caseolyticus]ARQ04412.1 hypothetical protein CA207_11610 [Macrococcus caseolyticus]
MIAEAKIKVNYDKKLDALYINFLNVSSDKYTDFDTEEIEDDIYRVFDSNREEKTYRYTILDFSYRNKKDLSELTGVDLDRFIE